MRNHLMAVGVGIFFSSVFALSLHNILIGIAIGTALGVTWERRHPTNSI
ncbi:MAG: hypothetical protein WCC97_06765 [Candidatus Acidiferrales bacterium]